MTSERQDAQQGSEPTVETPDYDVMPQSAIATGCVDHVLPPAEMPAQLITCLHQPLAKPGPPAPRTGEDADVFEKIFILLRGQTGHDFSQYKESTTTRRVERRMAVHQIDRVDRYLHYLENDPGEVEALFHDLLIGVTSFFRDPAAFQVLEAQVIPQLFAGRSASLPIRVWVPGCSSGEEAYSIAMLLEERMELLEGGFRCQVFATDIDGRAVEQARRGIYPASVVGAVSTERLARFFRPSPEGGHAYRVQNVIRDLLVFSEHDVVRDPPFSRLDLIGCRNLLIYMRPELQRKLVALFHYALNPGGFLFLGTSETVGNSPDLFATVDCRDRVFQRREVHSERRTDGGGARAGELDHA